MFTLNLLMAKILYFSFGVDIRTHLKIPLNSSHKSTFTDEDDSSFVSCNDMFWEQLSQANDSQSEFDNSVSCFESRFSSGISLDSDPQLTFCSEDVPIFDTDDDFLQDECLRVFVNYFEFDHDDQVYYRCTCNSCLRIFLNCLNAIRHMLTEDNDDITRYINFRLMYEDVPSQNPFLELETI